MISAIPTIACIKVWWDYSSKTEPANLRVLRTEEVYNRNGGNLNPLHDQVVNWNDIGELRRVGTPDNIALPGPERALWIQNEEWPKVIRRTKFELNLNENPAGLPQPRIFNLHERVLVRNLEETYNYVNESGPCITAIQRIFGPRWEGFGHYSLRIEYLFTKNDALMARECIANWQGAELIMFLQNPSNIWWKFYYVYPKICWNIEANLGVLLNLIGQLIGQ